MIDLIRDHVLELLNKDKRVDGRKFDEFRTVIVETDVTGTAEGSARVKIGDTEVIAGVKFGVESPYPDTPETGNFMINAEFLPLSSAKFESGPPKIDSIELARVVDRGIRESKMIDTKSLCLIVGEKVWSVTVDICTINVDGNLIDASALATLVALRSATFPEYDGIKVDYTKKTDKKMKMTKLPVCVTVVKAGGRFLVDLSEEEESAIEARLNVWTTEDGELCALQKGGTSSLSIEDINKMIEIATEKANELRRFLK